VWQCPTCGAANDDGLHACGTCGAAPAAKAALDSSPGHAAGKDIVELCSAANVVEAAAMVDALAEAGIAARVVNEPLQAAFDGMLGEITAPRVWVDSVDLSAARTTIAQWQAEQESPESPGPDEEPWPDRPEAESVEEESPSEPFAGHDVSFLSVVLLLVGLGLIAAGGSQAYVSHGLLARYSATTQAEYFDFRIIDQPRARAELWYRYNVEGVPYTCVIAPPRFTAREISIYYNPANPADFRVEAIPSPAMCAVMGVIAGAFLLFLAYQFR
jgi:hypothetical protein